MTAYQIAPRPSSLQKAERDPKYRAFVRRQRCSVCGTNWHVEFAHTGQRGKGTGVKATDMDGIPLCVGCHTASTVSYHAIGSESEWAAFHGVDLVAIRERLRSQYEGAR